MNKERIEQLAQETYKETDWTKPLSVEQTVASFATRFLAKVDAERAKEWVPARPTEEQREEIMASARKGFRYYQSGCRGQQVAEWDDPDTHIICATWDMCSKLFLRPQPIPEGYKLVPVDQSREGWKEAAIAWEVCASIHRKYAEGKDALFTTRQGDFVRHAETAREAMLAAAPEVKP